MTVVVRCVQRGDILNGHVCNVAWCLWYSWNPVHKAPRGTVMVASPLGHVSTELSKLPVSDYYHNAKLVEKRSAL